MTAYDAFAIAFDEIADEEVVAMDKKPRTMIHQKKNKKFGASGSDALPSAGGNLPKNGDNSQSLAQHMQQYHPDGFDPHKNKCKFFDALQKNFEQQGLSKEEAEKKALEAHNRSGYGGATGEAVAEEEGRQLADQLFQQLKAKPSAFAIEGLARQARLIQPPMEIEGGEDGEKIQIQDTFQLACMMFLQDQKESGNEVVENAAEKAENQIVETLGGEGEGTETSEEQSEEKHSLNLTSTDGSFSRDLTAEESAVLQQFPDRKEQLQNIVDLEARLQGSTEEEQSDLQNQIEALKIQFLGKEETAEGGGGTTTESSAPEEPKSDRTEPPRPAETPSEPSREPISEPASQEREPAPADEEFMTKNGKYKLGNVTYTDVSQHGLLGGMVAAFLAGLRGEGIITGWDRISGTWDQMKRSANGENVRDGIKGALTNLGIDGYMEKVKDPIAKGKLETIKEMFQKAKTPAQKMAAYKALEKWREAYKGELESMNAAEPGTAFSPLPNEYKGGKPPVSILGEPKGYKADTKYGEQVAEAIKNRLQDLGFSLEDGIPDIQVGPSATTIEFKVPPTFDMTAAKSNKTKEALKGAIGAPISNVEYASGKKDVLEITITNKEMRPVFFSDVMHSPEWQDFSQKGKIPMALGKDSRGKDKFLELTKMPHMMVTGATRSGKSVFLLSAMNSAEMAKTPDELRIVCIDPKEEFSSQKGSPHLLYPIPSKKTDIANVVASLRAEMEKRISQVGGTEDSYDPTKNVFAGDSNRNIDGFNAAHPSEKMPHIMVVFDEVADVMKDPTVGAQVSADMDKIMALGRSVGINCILATQRNDVASLSGSIQANMPAHLMFRASQDDHKASQAAKSLAGNGDYILKADGEETRGRGCYITDENVAAVPAYYRDHMAGSDEEQLKALEKELDGIHPEMTDSAQAREAEERNAAEVQRKIDKVKERMAKGSAGSGNSLPQEHQKAIKAAVEKGQPISMEAEEGFMDAFKSAFPEGWTVTEEMVDGKKHWKASPPEEKHEEAGTETPKKIEKVSDVPDDVDFDDVESLKTYRSRLEEAMKQISRNFKSFSQSKDREKALAPFKKKIEEVSALIPSSADIQDGDAIGEEDETMKGTNESSGSTPDPKSQRTMGIVERFFNKRKKELDKAIDSAQSIEEAEKLQAEQDALQERFDAAKAKYDEGGSPEDIRSIYEPKETTTPAKSEPETSSESDATTEVEQPQMTEEEKKAVAEQEQEQRNERLRKTVKPQEAYGESTLWGKREATERLTPKEVKSISEKYMPPGWEFVTENGFNAPARDRFGLIFVRDPATGSHGRLIPSKDNPGTYKLQKDVDTTHPEYKGMVQKEDGSWELSPEAAKVEAETRADRKQTKDPKKRKEALTRYHRAVFGHDEAPDNMTIVANAVAEALAKARMA